MADSRLMNDNQAAKYLNVPKTELTDIVEDGTIPAPLFMGKAKLRRWDRRAIDFQLDRKAGIVPLSSSDSASQTEREQAELMRRTDEW